MPLHDEDVVAAFGDPAPYLQPDGTISASWEALILEPIRLPAPLQLAWAPLRSVTSIRCHRLIAPFLQAALEAVHEIREAWADLDDFGGCYAWRPRRLNPHKLSRHSWGIAIDLDAKDNAQGAPPHQHPITVQVFQRCGFEWGGAWRGRSRDGMHFEFVDLNRLAAAV